MGKEIFLLDVHALTAFSTRLDFIGLVLRPHKIIKALLGTFYRTRTIYLNYIILLFQLFAKIQYMLYANELIIQYMLNKFSILSTDLPRTA